MPSQVLEPYDNFSKYPPFPPKNVIIFLIGILILCYLGAHANLWNPSCLLSGRKVRDSEEERSKTNNAIKSGHYVYACSPRAAHALSSDQFNGIMGTTARIDRLINMVTVLFLQITYRLSYI
jgi:hypothetical protein